MPTQQPLADAFWSKVDRRGPDDCWPWLAGRHGGGYGAFTFAGKQAPAHRVAWQLRNGRAIPEGLWALHRCDNRACVNPSHIFLGTPADNSADMVAKGRSVKGVPPPHAKLDQPTASAIRRLNGIEPQRQVAARFGVSPSTVSRIWHERTWVHA